MIKRNWPTKVIKEDPSFTVHTRCYRSLRAPPTELGYPSCIEFPTKQTLLILLEWLYSNSLVCERRVMASDCSFEQMARSAKNHGHFKRMIGEADILFPLFA